MIAPKKYSAAAGHADAFKASRPLELSAGFQPTLVGGFTFAGVAPRQEALDAQIFIQERPMDALAPAVELPGVALLFGPLLQARIPSQRERNGAAIIAIDDEGIGGDSEIFDEDGHKNESDRVR